MHLCVEATSDDDLIARLSTKSNSQMAMVPFLVAHYVDTDGWSFIEARQKLGEVLITTGVFDKLRNYAEALEDRESS